MESAMVPHALEAVCLSLAALPGPLGPRGRLHGSRDPGRAPVPQGLPLNRLSNPHRPGSLCPGEVPWPAIALGAILARLRHRGGKALQAVRRMLIAHAPPAHALCVAGPCHPVGMHPPVHAHETAPCGFHALRARGHTPLREMPVRWLRSHKHPLPCVLMGEDGVCARHEAAQPRALALRPGPAPPPRRSWAPRRRHAGRPAAAPARVAAPQQQRCARVAPGTASALPCASPGHAASAAEARGARTPSGSPAPPGAHQTALGSAAAASARGNAPGASRRREAACERGASRAAARE